MVWRERHSLPRRLLLWRWQTSPLTNSGQAIGFASRGLRILSHKGRGRGATRSTFICGEAVLRVYLSPCGRGYEGRVSFANPWPKLVRGALAAKTHFLPNKIKRL
jgi:hypothetical protein